MFFFPKSFGTLIVSHKFETEIHKQKRSIKNFLIFFVLFSNLHSLMKSKKPKWFYVGKYS